MFTFEDATLERAGLLQFHQSQTVPPFLVVASNDLNQVIPAFLQLQAVKLLDHLMQSTWARVITYRPVLTLFYIGVRLD